MNFLSGEAVHGGHVQQSKTAKAPFGAFVCLGLRYFCNSFALAEKSNGLIYCAHVQRFIAPRFTVGMNLFVVQSLRKSGSMNDVIIGALPFVGAMFVVLLLLALFPALAMWMPNTFG